MKRLSLLLLLLLACGASIAETLEVYPLSFRRAEEIIPLLEPHLAGRASLSGQGGQLIVRAGPQAQQEVAELLSRLDTAPRSLRIAVRSGAGELRQESGISGGDRIGSGGSSGSLRVYRSEDARVENLSQQVRAVEGRPAFIASAVLIPVTDRVVVIGREQTGVAEQTRFLELSKGFYATARVQGAEVEVEVAAEQAGSDRRGEGLQRHEVVTTIRGRLGEWLPVGRTGEGGSRSERGLIYRSRDAGGTNRTVWLKVDALD